ncbi:hypothetical protein L596_026864 [Steinernema carpocapsae]|uniref:Uncharacterized protein n=1 Tax=Steinernema carpocapsae TaxID=34508 RepID=A0A4U5M2L6_STECR|nr:hypothetical protein L596_026864 [Steinernema carpocapsae]
MCKSATKSAARESREARRARNSIRNIIREHRALLEQLQRMEDALRQTSNQEIHNRLQRNPFAPRVSTTLIDRPPNNGTPSQSQS